MTEENETDTVGQRQDQAEPEFNYWERNPGHALLGWMVQMTAQGVWEGKFRPREEIMADVNDAISDAGQVVQDGMRNGIRATIDAIPDENKTELAALGDAAFSAIAESGVIEWLEDNVPLATNDHGVSPIELTDEAWDYKMQLMQEEAERAGVEETTWFDDVIGAIPGLPNDIELGCDPQTGGVYAWCNQQSGPFSRQNQLER